MAQNRSVFVSGQFHKHVPVVACENLETRFSEQPHLVQMLAGVVQKNLETHFSGDSHLAKVLAVVVHGNIEVQHFEVAHLTQVPEKTDCEHEQQVLAAEQPMNDWGMQCSEAMSDVEVLELGRLLQVPGRKDRELDE